MTRRARQRRIFHGFLMVWALWGIALAALRAGRAGFSIGFRFNDAHIVVAGEWFARYGHWATLLTPPRHTAPRLDGTWELYNTYPAGVFWLHEIRRAMGLTELWQHRIAATLWNHMAVLLLFFLIRRITAETLIAAVAAGLYMFSAPYATTAGGLWEHAPMLSLLATLLAWLRFERARRPRARGLWLAASIALCALDSLLTVQHAMMIALVVGPRALRRAWRRRGAARSWVSPLAAGAAVISAPAFVLLARLLVNAELAGGFGEAWRALTRRAQMRMGLEGETEKVTAVWPTIAARLGLPWGEIAQSRSLQGWFPVFGAATLIAAAPIVVAALAFRRAPQLGPARRALGFGGALLLASLSWPTLFAQHSLYHPFVTLMLMPGAALVAGAIVVLPGAIGRAARARGLPRRPVVAVPLRACAAAVAASLVYGLSASELVNAYVPLNRRVRAEVVHREAVERRMRAAAAVVEGAEVMECGGNPIPAAQLGLPFRDIQAHARMPAHDGSLLLAVPVAGSWGQQAAASFAGRFGPPRFLAWPGDHVFYGHGTRPPEGSALAHPDIQIAPGVVWRDAAFAPTLDGGAWMCSSVIVGEHVRLLRERGWVMRVRVLDSESRVLAETDSVVGRLSFFGRGVLLIRGQVSAESAREWREVTITIEDSAAASVTTRLRRP